MVPAPQKSRTQALSPTATSATAPPARSTTRAASASPSGTRSSRDRLPGDTHAPGRPYGCGGPENGHVAIVTETGLGASTTNSAGEIWDELTARFPGPLVLLEHWPAGDGDDHDRLDQVGLVGRRPTWRRIWPTAPANPDHHLRQTWIQAYGHDLLAVSQPAA
ncbi:hypothetical protein [Streptomyces soliscabiei]|uniref:hypothetical protein n=1 Tax=Streptomyces soliscabiei TaxID=588897 RepID=UPI0029B9394C|nr:hypothetical protein [Streptomyces sp. NY05-11A]MDX2683711.1 hypothetical protein [Streptomyces sp. NY05-11A]